MAFKPVQGLGDSSPERCFRKTRSYPTYQRLLSGLQNLGSSLECSNEDQFLPQCQCGFRKGRNVEQESMRLARFQERHNDELKHYGGFRLQQGLRLSQP